MEPIRVKQLSTDRLGNIVAFSTSELGIWVLVVFDDGKIGAAHPGSYRAVKDDAAEVQA